MRDYYRHTKIIATVGPATESPEQLGKLIRAGLDVMRLNMAHGSGEWVTTLVARIREVSVAVQRHVAVMMDVKGPRRCWMWMCVWGCGNDGDGGCVREWATE